MLGGNPREVVMTLKLNMLPPSVNNMSVRVFVRAAGLPYEEENVAKDDWEILEAHTCYYYPGYYYLEGEE